MTDPIFLHTLIDLDAATGRGPDADACDEDVDACAATGERNLFIEYAGDTCEQRFADSPRSTTLRERLRMSASHATTRGRMLAGSLASGPHRVRRRWSHTRGLRAPRRAPKLEGSRRRIHALAALGAAIIATLATVLVATGGESSDPPTIAENDFPEVVSRGVRALALAPFVAPSSARTRQQTRRQRGQDRKQGGERRSEREGRRAASARRRRIVAGQRKRSQARRRASQPAARWMPPTPTPRIAPSAPAPVAPTPPRTVPPPVARPAPARPPDEFGFER